VLAERLAGLDLRDYLSLGELRSDLIRVVGDYCRVHPAEADQFAFEPFFFCESIEVSAPLGVEAGTLEEFRQVLEGLTNASFHYHFITSRLRLQLRTNDFSLWFQSALGLEPLAPARGGGSGVGSGSPRAGGGYGVGFFAATCVDPWALLDCSFIGGSSCRMSPGSKVVFKTNCWLGRRVTCVLKGCQAGSVISKR